MIEPNPPKQPTANQPLTIVKGKPYVHQYPTPNPKDRVFYIRKDSRTGSYEVPEPGTPFTGKGSFVGQLKGFVFACAKPADEAGQYNWFYVNARQNQDAYNFVVDYPYTDRRFPRVTRTYVVPRDNVLTQEPDADSKDVVFSGMSLTEHKIARFDDPIFDSVFVVVTRVFDTLPGPVITSFAKNKFSQKVTTRTQEVVASDPPRLSAVVEEAQQERTTTAKAKNTIATVPRVFPASMYKTEIPSMTRELWMGGFIEFMQSQRSAGQAAQQSLTSGVYGVTETQENEFVKVRQDSTLPLPQTRQHKETTEQYGGGILLENLDIDTPTSPLDVEQGYLVTSSSFRNLAGFGKVRKTFRLNDTAWPVLHEEKIMTAGIYAGIKILIDKQIVPAGTPNPGGFTDMLPHDKWRTLQITSRVDPSSLPRPLVYGGSHPLSLPPTLVGITAIYGDRGGSTSTLSNNGGDTENVSVSLESGPLGSISATFIEGFHGLAVARITRIFTLTPPVISGTGIIVNGVLRTPFKFLPTHGTATMTSVYSRFTQAIGGNPDGTLVNKSQGSSGQIRTQTSSFRAALSGTPVIRGINALTGQSVNALSFNGAASSAGATTSDGVWHISATLPGNTCHMTMDIPVSTPSALPASGSFILAGIDVAAWRFNVWVIHLIEALIP